MRANKYFTFQFYIVTEENSNSDDQPFIKKKIQKNSKIYTKKIKDFKQRNDLDKSNELIIY